MTKLSEILPKLMLKLLKNSAISKGGMISYPYKTTLNVEFDQDECEKILGDLVVHKDNVLRYLGHKYKPSHIENGMIFKDSKCIQKAIVKEDCLFIHMANSELHKIITDTIHIKRICDQQGYDTNKPVKFVIDCIKMAMQDIPLYIEFLNDRDIKSPIDAIKYTQNLLKQYPNLESIAGIKKRSIKRKLLRYHVKRGKLIWEELRRIINITDFSSGNIKLVCNNIREDVEGRGITIDI